MENLGTLLPILLIGVVFYLLIMRPARMRQRKQAHVEALEFELSCCRSENEHLRQRVAALEERLAALSVGGAFRAAAPSAIECN